MFDDKYANILLISTHPLILADCQSWYMDRFFFHLFAKNHQVSLVAELTCYSDSFHIDGSLAYADVQCFQTVHIQSIVFTSFHRPAALAEMLPSGHFLYFIFNNLSADADEVLILCIPNILCKCQIPKPSSKNKIRTLQTSRLNHRLTLCY